MSGAFDQIWDLIKARPQRPDYFMDVVPEGADLDNIDQMIQDSPTMLDVNVVGGAGDECCADLRNGLANLKTWSLNHYKGLSGQMNEAVHGSIPFNEGIEGASCETLVEALDDAISYGEYAFEEGGNTVAYWKDYGFESEQHAMAEHRELLDDEDGKHEKEYLDRLRQLKLEYDACKMGGFDDAKENEATGFYASADPFERTWDLLMKGIDDDENDDEFIDNDQFNNPALRAIQQILGIADSDLVDATDECYSCGFEGTLHNFMQMTPSGRPENRCPECGSTSIHGKDAYKNVPDRSNESYEDEMARRNAYYREIEEKLRQKKTGVGPGNE